MPNLQSTPGTITVPGGPFGAAASATLNQDAGTISVNLNTVALTTCTLALNSNQITPNSILSIEIANGTNTQGDPTVGLVTPGNGIATIAISNRHATQTFNGTLKVAFVVFN